MYGKPLDATTPVQWLRGLLLPELMRWVTIMSKPTLAGVVQISARSDVRTPSGKPGATAAGSWPCLCAHPQQPLQV